MHEEEPPPFQEIDPNREEAERLLPPWRAAFCFTVATSNEGFDGAFCESAAIPTTKIATNVWHAVRILSLLGLMAIFCEKHRGHSNSCQRNEQKGKEDKEIFQVFRP